MDNNYNHKQIQVIKLKLLSIIEKKGINNYSLYNKIINSNLQYDFSFNTFNSTLSLSNNTLNICVVLAICNYYNLDKEQIFASPEMTSTKCNITPDYNIYIKNRNLSVFDDYIYYSNYYIGYLYSPNYENNTRRTFELEFCHFDKTTKFHYMLNENPDNQDNIYSGIPIELKKEHSVFIPLINYNGDYCLLFFHKQLFQVATDVKCIQGFCIMPSTFYERKFIIQKFVMYDKSKPNMLNDNIINELLKFDRESCKIECDTLYKLALDNENVKWFYDEFKSLLDYKKIEFYNIDFNEFFSIAYRKLKNRDTIDDIFSILGSNSINESRISFCTDRFVEDKNLEYSHIYRNRVETS